MKMSKKLTRQSARANMRLWLCACCCLLVGVALMSAPASCQRDDRDNDDFDDAGFDDSGYNSPQSHDAEGSQQNPSSYSPSSEEDLDDDDDVDESSQVAKATAPPSGAQQFYAPANSIVMPIPLHAQRQKRSVPVNHPKNDDEPTSQLELEGDIEQLEADSSRPLIRKRRYSKHYIGPVYTYVKTDKHAHYKWGVKHKVGKHMG